MLPMASIQEYYDFPHCFHRHLVSATINAVLQAPLRITGSMHQPGVMLIRQFAFNQCSRSPQ